MLKQLFVSIVVVAAAAAAWVFFFPGAQETLARYGISLPVAAPPPAENGQPAGAEERGPQAGGQLANVPPAANPQAGADTRPGANPQAQPGNPGGERGGNARQGGRGPGGNRTPTVIVAAVTLGTLNNRLAAVGEGAAAHSVTVTAASGGKLVSLEVAPGDIVEAGDLIARLEAESEQIAFDRAELAAKDADAALERTTTLANSNSATTVQLSAAQLAAENARLELQSAQLALTRRSIVAPIGGTVGLFQVSPGNYLDPQTPVTTIEDTGDIVLSFWVPERYAPQVRTGMPVEASAVALPGVSFTGEVTAIDNRVDPASRTLEVEARIPNPSGEIRPGMSFLVNLAFPGQQFPTVDPLSIQWSAEGAYVWKYSGGTVEKALVDIVQRNSDGVMVKGELASGDTVVTQGVQQLSPGATVRLLDEPVETAAEREVAPPSPDTPAPDAARLPAPAVPATTPGAQPPAATTAQPPAAAATPPVEAAEGPDATPDVPRPQRRPPEREPAAAAPQTSAGG